MKRIFGNGRYANVTATMALIIALSGTAYAANTVRSSDIVNGQVKSVDIGTGQVKNRDIFASAVTSGKVRNGSLRGKDFKAGEIPAGAQGAQGPRGFTGPGGAMGSTGPAGQDAVPNVTVSNIAAATSTTGTTPTTLPDLTQSITIPAGPARRILATLSGESLCSGTAGNWCSVRILLDGTELTPAEGLDFSFDAVDDNGASTASWEANSIQRYSGTVAAGAHSVTVEVDNTEAATTLRLDDAVLSVMQIAG